MHPPLITIHATSVPRPSQHHIVQVPHEDDIRLVCNRLALTPRETDVVYQAMLGKSRAAIARDLCLATATVDGYWKSMCQKLQVSSRKAVVQRIWQELYQPLH